MSLTRFVLSAVDLYFLGVSATLLSGFSVLQQLSRLDRLESCGLHLLDRMKHYRTVGQSNSLTQTGCAGLNHLQIRLINTTSFHACHVMLKGMENGG